RLLRTTARNLAATWQAAATVPLKFLHRVDDLRTALPGRPAPAFEMQMRRAVRGAARADDLPALDLVADADARFQDVQITRIGSVRMLNRNRRLAEIIGADFRDHAVARRVQPRAERGHDIDALMAARAPARAISADAAADRRAGDGIVIDALAAAARRNRPGVLLRRAVVTALRTA